MGTVPKAALDLDLLLSNEVLSADDDDSAFSRTTMSPHRHSDSGTIPSMTSVQHELRDNTIIVGKHSTPSIQAPVLAHVLLVFGASGDLAKKKVGTIGN